MYNDIELHIAMPYEEQATNRVEEIRERFFRLHTETDHVELISNHYTDDCYDIADEYMIDDSELLLIVGKCDKGMYSQNYFKGIKVEHIQLL